MFSKSIFTIAAAAILALAVGQVHAGTIPVPNGDFKMYKPGTGYTVRATFPEGNIWTTGMGDNAPINGDLEAIYADGTTGKAVDVPGWITPVDSQGSPTGTCDLFTVGYDDTDDSSCLNAFGEWSGQNGNLAQSAEPLGNVAAKTHYTVSAMINGNAGAFTLELRAGGVPMPVTSSVNPISSGGGTSDWEVISTTYTADAITAFIGQPITIVVGTKRPGAGDPALYGQRSRCDNITVTTVSMATDVAHNPDPADGATDVGMAPILSWSPGDFTQELNEHDLYLGESFDDVNGATSTDHPNVIYQNLDVNNFDPGNLELGKTFYWRVDQINDANVAGLWKGAVWRFTTSDYAIVDDMESYTPWTVPGDNIFEAYKDGMGNCEPGNGNGTGANLTENVAEIFVYNGLQSMKYDYDNDGLVYNPCVMVPEPRPHKYSMIKGDLANLGSGIGSDWTVSGIRALVLHFYGDETNGVEPMWLELTDDTGGSARASYGDFPGEDANDIAEASWHEWNIDLGEFSDGGVDLTNVKSIAIGIGTEGATEAGGSGTVYFDDIVLYPTRCVRQPLLSEGNFNDDCMIDLLDLALMAENYLVPGMWP